MRLRVCAKGLSGTAKTRKHEAPSGAISGRDARLDCVSTAGRKSPPSPASSVFAEGGALAQPVGPVFLGERRQLHFRTPGMVT